MVFIMWVEHEPVRNVFSVEHILELDALYTLVSFLYCFFKRVSSCCSRYYAATGGANLAIDQ